MSLSETTAQPGQPLNMTCLHVAHVPAFNEAACVRWTPAQIRATYPAYRGTCQTCGQRITVWASLAHYLAVEEAP